jgi:hypothetical protein
LLVYIVVRRKTKTKQQEIKGSNLGTCQNVFWRMIWFKTRENKTAGILYYGVNPWKLHSLVSKIELRASFVKLQFLIFQISDKSFEPTE